MNGAWVRRLAMVGTAALFIAGCGGGADPAEEAANQLAEQIIENAGDGSVAVDIDDNGSMNIDVDGEDGSSVSIDTDNEGSVAIQIDGDDGGMAIIGGGEVPEGFPIPVPDGGQVISSIVGSSDEGAGAQVMVQYPAGRFEELAASYQSWIDGQGLEVTTMDMSTTEAKMIQFIGSGADGSGVMISVTDAEDGVVVMLVTGN